MSEGSAPSHGPIGTGARALLARAAGADARARATLATAIEDAFLSPDGRLDDATRAALGALIAAMAGTIEGELTEHAVRLLATRGEGDLADLLARETPPVVERLASAGLLRDGDFAAECIARVRIEMLTAALPVDAGPDADSPSLLTRLAQSSDRVVAAAAASVMIGESHRRGVTERATLPGTGLVHGLHARLVWWVAAALRDRAARDADAGLPALDRAIAEAALRNLAAHDDGDRLEAAATRLAEAVDAQAGELPALLDEILRDRRLVVFAAFLAHALGVSYELARDLVIDPAGDRLWIVLRAFDVPRDVIARVGFNLCEADPRRDVESFADTLDVVAALDPETARLAVAPLRLHPDYRAALLALDGAGGRA
ncbi:MAG: DUF2336 domain-containing protein [Pseudomonadota bacterium]